jgi:hypothetical protein
MSFGPLPAHFSGALWWETTWSSEDYFKGCSAIQQEVEAKPWDVRYFLKISMLDS